MGKKISDEELAEKAARYDVLKEFYKKEGYAYKEIRKRGLFDRLCGHMKRKEEPYFSNEELEIIASRYSVLKDFRKKESHAYRSICQRGLLDKLCNHMVRTSNGRTVEELAEIAAKYDVLQEFYDKEYNIYESIRKRGLKDILCSHMKRKDGGRYFDEELAAIASRYDVLKVFIRREKTVYGIIRGRGLFDRLCGHMKRDVHPRYTDKELREIASGYDSLKELEQKEPGVYSAIKKRGLTDELYGHIKFKKQIVKYAPVSNLAAIADKYKTLKDFINNDYTVYRTIRDRGLFDKLCGHMVREVRTSISDKELATIALRYKTKKELIENDYSAYMLIHRRGIADKLLGHMKPIGNWMRRKIYAFTFSDGYAYVGLSFDPDYRYMQHTKNDKNSPVFKHIQETGSMFVFTILTDWIDMDKVGKMEDDYIKKYAADGWKMLNKVKGGGLGSPRKGKSKEEGV